MTFITDWESRVSSVQLTGVITSAHLSENMTSSRIFLTLRERPRCGGKAGSKASLVVVAAFIRRDDDEEAVALTIDAQQRLLLCLSHQTTKIGNRTYGLAVDSFDHVTRL